MESSDLAGKRKEESATAVVVAGLVITLLVVLAFALPSIRGRDSMESRAENAEREALTAEGRLAASEGNPASVEATLEELAALDAVMPYISPDDAPTQRPILHLMPRIEAARPAAGVPAELVVTPATPVGTPVSSLWKLPLAITHTGSIEFIEPWLDSLQNSGVLVTVDSAEYTSGTWTLSLSAWFSITPPLGTAP